MFSAVCNRICLLCLLRLLFAPVASAGNRSAYLLALTLPVLFLHPLAHAKRDAAVTQAAQYLRDGQPQRAFDLLSPLEVERAGDPDFDLALGIASSQTQRYTLAIMALERAVQQKPDSVRAQTELAGAYYAVRDYERAARLFAQVRSAGVPEAVGRQIDLLLSSMNAPQMEGQSSGHNAAFQLNQSISFTIGRDSNVNRAPSQTTFRLPGYAISLPLSEESRKARSSYASLGYTASAHRAFHQNWAWLGSVQFNTRTNHSARRLNTQSIQLTTGGVYSRERHELSLLFHTSLQSLRGRKAATSSGISSNWTWHLDGYRQLSVGLGYFKNNNHLSRYSSSRKSSLDVAWAQQLRSGTFLFAGVGHSAEKPEHYRFADRRTSAWGIRAGIRHHFLQNLALSASLTHEHRSYAGTDSTFLQKRTDREYHLQTTLDWVALPHLTISPTVGTAASSSSIDFYSYRRKYLSVSARYSF